ncbi:MAG TPA: AraC family transcriptional regulator [Streptosporangiaceae bacterium]
MTPADSPALRAVGDTFARFLDLLTEHLDDGRPDGLLRGDELAARLHVSRSVLDRIVAASAGETAGKLRRRLLLERAAYQLRTSQASVLDVAVAAGYSSNEAFTRAFQRAFGAPPSAWRAAPAPVHLPAPGGGQGVHFYPPGGFRFPATREATAVNFAAELIDQHITVIAQLLDRAATLSEEQLDAPIELSVEGIDENPTIRSLLSRLVGQLDMWNAAMASTEYDFGVEQHESLQSMRARLTTAGGSFASFVRSAAEQDRMGETFVDATCEPYVFTIAGMVGHVLVYAAYRRTLVAGAVASAGAPPVQDDPLTWFAAPGVKPPGPA